MGINELIFLLHRSGRTGGFDPRLTNGDLSSDAGRAGSDLTEGCFQAIVAGGMKAPKGHATLHPAFCHVPERIIPEKAGKDDDPVAASLLVRGNEFDAKGFPVFQDQSAE